MMVDLGGGAREHFQTVSVEEPEEPLPPISSLEYTHLGSRSVSWRSTLQGQDTPNRLNLLDSTPHSLIQIKSDPENLGGLCISNSSTGSLMTLSGPPSSTEDAQVKGQLLQEITRVAETFEPYNSSSMPPGCYRNYNLPSDAQSHTDYILTDTPQWCWSRSTTDDKSLSGHNAGGLYTGTGSSNETVINPLQYNVPSHLMSDAFSSPQPPVSVTQSPTSVPSCSPIQRPPPPSTLTSSALDLSPGPPPIAHQLPLLQPSLITPASAHMTLGSTSHSTHQLPTLQPSLITLDVPSQAISAHDTLDDTLDLVGVEAPRSHEKMPEFECGDCGALFTRLPHLKYHMKVHAEEMEISGNKQGDFTTDSPNSKVRVQSPDKVFPCKHCDEKFSRAEKLKTHELKHSGDRPFRCNDCGTAFPAKAMLIRHKKVHTGEKPYKCDICKMCFTESGSLKVHKRLHSGEKPFKCDQCDVAFNGAGMLATHKRKHTGERPYMCDECGETFRLLSTLKTHRRRHTGEKPFVCELCGSSFTQRAAMQRHKRIHSNQKPWECEQCGYKFREKENLRKHIALHKIKQEHMCDICGAGFNQAKKLETHKMLHNGGDRPYQCNKCPSTFTNPKYLTQHKKRVHDRKGAIKCEECNGTFKRKETLRSHMRIHKGERPYVCDECGAAFNQRGTLTKHIRVHGNQALINNQSKDFETKSFDQAHVDTDNHSPDKKEGEETTFNCSVCSLRFPSEKELVRHIRSSHPSHKTLQGNSVSDQDVDDSSEHIRDKYICEDCDQTFFRRRQLKAHKKYCPCWCPAYQTELPDKVGSSTVQNDAREVDAMKLLTAVLAVTGNNTGEVSGFHHSPSSSEHPSSVSTVALHSPSSSTITSNVEEHHERHESLKLFSSCDSSYTEHLHINLKDSHIDQSPQHPSHFPQSPQPQHSLLHQTSQGHHQLDHSHLSLEHLSQDHMQHSSHIQPSDHPSSHILLSQSYDHLHHSSRQPTHLQQQPPQTDTHVHHQTQDPSEDHARSHSSLQYQEVSQQQHLQLIPRQYTHLQDPLKEHSHIAPSSRHQNPPHQSTKLQILSLKETQLHQPSHETNPTHYLQHKQNHHDDLVLQGQIFKSPPLSLSDQHLHHHHLPHSEESDQNAHLQEHPSHILPDIKGCDELAHSLQHQGEENSHCHNNQHNQHLAQHFDENEQSNSDPPLHHHHHQQQQQNPFCPTLECPVNIKIENIIS